MRAHARGGRVRSRLTGALLLTACLAWPAPPVHAQTPAAGEAPLVAVLPFRVHSAKPLDYLGESLANLLRARLEASGEVRVLDPGRVGSAPAPAAEARVREVARELGAAWVVSGSLTELAGRYSLDVRVTPAEPALSSHTLVLTADRDDELLERVNDVADRVVAEVVGAAPAVVAGIELRGASELQDDLRERLTSRVGEPYDPATVRDDLAMMRGDPAVANAAVEVQRGPEGVVLEFRIAAVGQLGPVAGPQPRAGERVAEVRVRGNARIEAGAILARVSTKPGDRYRGGAVAKDVRDIYALGFFRDVKVYRESGPSGLVLIFQVEENPIVRQISISGNDNLEGDKIRDILTLTTGSTLEYPLLFENRARIETMYRAQGYYLAEVSYEVEPLSETSVGIHFEVEENKKLRLKHIEFTGNETFSAEELRADFQTKPWRFWSYATSWFDKSGTYSEPLFRQDLRSAGKVYYDAGFLQVEIGEPKVVPSEGGLTVTVPVTEGRRFRVGAIDVSGDTTVDIGALHEMLQLKEGEIFNRSYLTEDVATLTDFYTNRGFYFANVAPLSNLSPDTDVVDVVFQVRKGPLYFIRQINISGNTISVDPVIRREVPIVEGQLYSQRAIQMARQRIQGLGFFEEVDIKMEPTEDPEQLDLEVNVVERPTGSFSFGAGFSSQDSIVVTGSLSQSNLFGRGYDLRLSADVGGETQRFFLGFTDPYVFGSTYSMTVNASLTRLRFEDFDQDQIGGDFVLGHTLSEDGRTRGFLRYSINWRQLDEDTNVDAASTIFRQLFNDTLTTSQLGLSFISDTRNDRMAPTAGYQLGGSVEVAGLGLFSRFVRAEARAAWFLGAPRWMPERSTFVVSSRVGYALPLNDISDYDAPIPDAADQLLIAGSASGNVRALPDIDDDMKLPLSERYFMGGVGQFQLRGFKARSVGPRRAILRRSPTPDGGVFFPQGFDPLTPIPGVGTGACLNGPGTCNNIDDTKNDDFANLDATDVVGGNKFISSSIEYRFPISELLGLQGLLFFDTGNAFAEGDSLFDIGEWRYGTGLGVQWFSPFGPLGVIVGFPIDKLSVEDFPVFEFSVGGGGL
ncbi:MAG: outer membrane protein assembly factor BamA [Myxococcota bacterium]